MANDLITQTLKDLYLRQQKSLNDIRNYFSMKYRIDLDEKVLKIRLKKLLGEEQAVA
ncbi:hypothetical protein [Algoriphagus namhaensis]